MKKLGSYLPECYNEEFIQRATNPKYKKTIIVSFSHDDKFNLLTYLKEFDSLFYSLKEMNFYMKDSEIFFNHIKKIILDNEYERVICVGMSKGGTMAIIAACALADIMQSIKFYSLAFSPSFRFYPFMPSKFLHYIQLIKFAKTDNNVLENLKLFGDTKKMLAKPRENVYNYVMAGENNLNDMASAYILQGFCKYLKIFFIDCSYHFAIVNFILNQNIANNKKKIKILMAWTLNNNSELSKTFSNDFIDYMVESYMKIKEKDGKKLLDLNSLIDILINDGKIDEIYK